ncbi:hypothetical protein [Salinispira pacifica]|uniref:OmpA family protein n=1 Tax=Salinispira pacifica TaxID=1307761 RepID=V5WIX3_9SPIO|nr:hypothetical protein [Salinispira pacifica]AHC15565.1 OmpA family protein [Salinispira pacifica]
MNLPIQVIEMKHIIPDSPAAALRLLLLVIMTCFVLPALLPLHSLNAQMGVDSSMDWENGILRVTVSRTVDDRGYNLPAALYSAELEIERRLPDILFRELLNVQVDSWNSLEDTLRNEPELISFIENLSATAEHVSVRPDPSVPVLHSSYALELYPRLSGELVRHGNSFPMNEVLQWQPGSDYSGIVIYAGRELPVHGEQRSAALEPALFPVIYDENMRVVADKNRLDPEYASRWGVAAYTRGFDESEHRERIGDNPYRIIATSLFGITPSDPLIPPADADVLLYSENNRRLLREGRILIIY